MATAWLYEVRASDVTILGAGLMVVVAIALSAVVISARRVSQVAPALALRPE